MTASIMYGKHLAAEIKQTIKQAVSERIALGENPPGLAVVQVGSDPASSIYVKHKRHACLEVGFNSFAYDLPTHTSQTELLALIDTLNDSKEVDGILVQLPLPEHIQKESIIERINPSKDVDGFHPYNFGRLALGLPCLRPCTPWGVMALLKHHQIDVAGLHAVVVGASNIVGRPMALELLMAKATVTICHSATKNLSQHIQMADLIIVATGTHNLIKPEWLNSTQILMDIGMHRGHDGKVHGDIDFHKAVDKLAWITPVPGGVGPMTICMLLQNTLCAALNGRGVRCLDFSHFPNLSP